MNHKVFKIDVGEPTTVSELRVILKDNNIRLAVYEFMLEELNERITKRFAIGLCHCVPAFIKMVEDDWISTRLRVLPELWKKKPVITYGSHWFPERDSETRLRVLQKCIDKVTKKIQTSKS